MARGLSSKAMYSRFYNRFAPVMHAGNYAAKTHAFKIKNGRLHGNLNGYSFEGGIGWSRFSNGECWGSIWCEITDPDGKVHDVPFDKFKTIIKASGEGLTAYL